MNSVIWALLAAGIWGVVPLLEKLGLEGVKPMAGLFYRCIGVLMGLVILMIFMVKPDEIRSIRPRSIVLLLAGGFLASFVAQICFYNSLKHGEVSRIVPISGSYPFVAFILGITILGEAVTGIKLAGAVLIISGIWILRGG